MAIKPKVYKCPLQLSDTDRHVYGDFSLTLVHHPSETLERLCARLLAFCFNADEALKFAGGLSVDDEPEIWLKNDHGEVEQWYELGQPDPERLKKLSRRCRQLSVYCFAKSTPTWWQINGDKIRALGNCRVEFLPWELVEEIANAFVPGQGLSVSISDGTAYINIGDYHCELSPENLCEFMSKEMRA